MAQAILLQDVENVGERGQVIDVSPGYLRNYLLPRKLAQSATPGAIAEEDTGVEFDRTRNAQQRRIHEIAWSLIHQFSPGPEKRWGDGAALATRTPGG